MFVCFSNDKMYCGVIVITDIELVIYTSCIVVERFNHITMIIVRNREQKLNTYFMVWYLGFDLQDKCNDLVNYTSLFVPAIILCIKHVLYKQNKVM